MLEAFVFVVGSIVSGHTYKCKDENGEWTEAACVGNLAPPQSNDYPSNIPAHRPTRSSNASDPVWCVDGPASANLIAECLEMWRPILRDPRGAYADSGMLVHHQSNGKLAVFLDGHAKNGFGGTNAMFMQCELDAAGRINSAGTKELIKLREAFFELKVEPTLPKVVVCKTLQHNNTINREF